MTITLSWFTSNESLIKFFISVVFSIFDRDGDGRLNASDIAYAKQCVNDSTNQSSDFGIEQDFQIDEFILWCETNEGIIEMIEMISEVLHISFGIRASSIDEEIRLVK